MRKKDPHSGEKIFLLCDKMWAIQFDTIRNCQQNDVDPFNSDLSWMDWQAEKSEKEISPHESSARMGKLFH